MHRLIVLTALVVSSGFTAHAQSLGDIAKKAAEQREQKKDSQPATMGLHQQRPEGGTALVFHAAIGISYTSVRAASSRRLSRSLHEGRGTLERPYAGGTIRTGY